jgi:hypothetical protein
MNSSAFSDQGLTRVGPVFEAGDVGQALTVAMQELNPGLMVIDRGGYLRLVASARCVLTREAAERVLGRPFQLPGDLEAVMPSFQGSLQITDDRAIWSFRKAA